MDPHQTYVDAVDIEFHGVTYTISIVVHGEELLVVNVEDKDTLDSWRGEFAAKYVEDITSKTGSFKKFSVFVRMLQSAVLQQSDSVCVDLLTYQDLELLKAKKAAAASGGAAAAAPVRQLPASNKRYLILTYASEFDRVHYPLPLLADEQPDPARLKAVISSLRQQLAAVQAGLPPPQLLQPHAAQQLMLPGRTRSSSRCSPQHQGPDGDAAALLASRLEVAQAELERERAAHRREIRKKVREVQELQEELARSRDVARDLRLRLKSLETELEAARRSSTAAAAAAGPGKNGYRRPAAADRYTYGSSSSGYLSGSSKFPSRPTRTSGTGSSRGSSPASSRAQSPGYNRPWAQNSTPPRPPRPSSAPPKQRFDPTEYIKQKREREQQRLAARRGSSSRGSSPARSTHSSRGGGDLSASSTPRSAVSPSASFGGGRERQLQHAASMGSSGGGSRREWVTSGNSSSMEYMKAAGGVSGSRAGSASRQQRPGSASRLQRPSSASNGRDALGGVYGVAPAAGSHSRSGSAQRSGSAVRDVMPRTAGRDGPGAASPGRALQGVRDKLNAYYAKQQQQQQQLMQPGSALPGPVSVSTHAMSAKATGPEVSQQAAPLSAVLGGNSVLRDAGSEIADIDQRLHALQNFLKMAKSSVAAT